MNAAEMHVYFAGMTPAGKKTLLHSKGGTAVKTLFEDQYDPFITMMSYSFEENLPFISNIPKIEQRKKTLDSKYKLNPLLTVNPKNKDRRKQITVILRDALIAAKIINSADITPLAMLDEKLKEANKRLHGWPQLSQPLNRYNYFTNADALKVINAKKTIKVVDLNYNPDVTMDAMVGPMDSILDTQRTHIMDEEETFYSDDNELQQEGYGGSSSDGEF
jgi:hypothetical protein